VGEQKFRTWSQLPPKERLRALLGDQWWGPHAKTGDEWIQTYYLLHLEQERAALLTTSAAEQQQQFGHPHRDRCRTLSAGRAGARAHGSTTASARCNQSIITRCGCGGQGWHLPACICAREPDA
jgi:hypothetical protein